MGAPTSTHGGIATVPTGALIRAMAENPAAMQRRRGPSKPFRPGQSGNPAGKSKGTRHLATMLAEGLLDGGAEDMRLRRDDLLRTSEVRPRGKD